MNMLLLSTTLIWLLGVICWIINLVLMENEYRKDTFNYNRIIQYEQNQTLYLIVIWLAVILTWIIKKG